MVDLMQVLEAATYAAFIAGAIFAVMELRTMSRERKMGLILRFNEFWCSKDFVEAFTKVKRLGPKDKDPRQIEEKCTEESLWMVMDYITGVGDLYYDNLLDRKFVFGLIAWDLIWQRLEPWVIDVRQKVGNPYIGLSLEGCAAEERQRAAGVKGPFPSPWINVGRGG